MIFLIINCPHLSRLVWRRHTKFQIGMAAAIPAIPLPAPLGVGKYEGCSYGKLYYISAIIRPTFIQETHQEIR